LDGPTYDWPEGPGLIESIRRYRWLVLAIVLAGAVAAFAWSSTQPVRYEGVVRVFVAAQGEQATDPGRIVRSQAEYLKSPEVLTRAAALTDGRVTPKELEQRLSVEPARDADVITIRVLESTAQGAASLADTVVRAYREVVARQTAEAARQQAATLERRQRQLEAEIATLNRQLQAQPGNPRLVANRDAKQRLLNSLADQREAARPAARADGSVEGLQERAAVPDEPAQPKPLRTAAIGAVLALMLASALAWWLNGRRLADERLLASLREGRAVPAGSTALASLPPAARLLRGGRQVTVNGTRAGNGSVSGIADFDQVAASVQQLFRSLDGPPQQLYEENLPQLAAEQIAQSFEVDLVAILLRTGDEVRTMGSVGLQPATAGLVDQAVGELIEQAAGGGPRLVDADELPLLAGIGLDGDQEVSLALVPLVRDQVGFGLLLAGRRPDGEAAAPHGEQEVEEIAASTREMVPYLWAWQLLRSLKLRLGTLR
jgi:capsular polysaccharide biosynthesis protein